MAHTTEHCPAAHTNTNDRGRLTSFRLPPPLLEQVRDRAARDDRSTASLIRRYLREGLDRDQEGERHA